MVFYSKNMGAISVCCYRAVEGIGENDSLWRYLGGQSGDAVQKSGRSRCPVITVECFKGPVLSGAVSSWPLITVGVNRQIDNFDALQRIG